MSNVWNLVHLHGQASRLRRNKIGSSRTLNTQTTDCVLTRTSKIHFSTVVTRNGQLFLHQRLPMLIRQAVIGPFNVGGGGGGEGGYSEYKQSLLRPTASPADLNCRIIFFLPSHSGRTRNVDARAEINNTCPLLYPPPPRAPPQFLISEKRRA